MRSRKTTHIPEKFWGKGRSGFMLYDWVHHRGRGACKPSQKFKHLVQWQNTKLEYLAPRKLMRRMHIGGPRFAVMATRKK